MNCKLLRGYFALERKPNTALKDFTVTKNTQPTNTLKDLPEFFNIDPIVVKVMLKVKV